MGVVFIRCLYKFLTGTNYNTKETNPSKMLCLMFVYLFYMICVRTDFVDFREFVV